ncbi:MAG: hypothetical protein DRJ43_05820 [Thermoprotei archaeon]|nr:MAG: hypothetical protein DRJ43_05820 [Thermoprotei archaeon]
MRVYPVIVAILVAVALLIYWIPITVNVGGYEYKIGGYPWLAPTPQARSFFMGLGVAISILGAALVVLEFKFSRDIESIEEELESV